MRGILHWPSAPARPHDPANRADLGIMMRTAVRAATPVEVDTADRLSASALDGYDFLVLSDAHIDQRVLTLIGNAASLRWIQLSSSGAERAISAGLHTRYKLTNAAHVWAPSVADHAVALLLSLTRQVPALARLQAARTWAPQEAGKRMRALNGMTAVILGCGAVGQAIASRITAFGVRVIGVNREGSPLGAPFTSCEPVSRLHEVLERADILFVSVPLRPATRHLIGARAIEILGPDAYVINVSRGPILDTVALEQALESAALAGVGLDVTDPEPLAPDSSLWNSDRVIISPHLATLPAPATAGEALGALIRDNAERLRRGQALMCTIS